MLQRIFPGCFGKKKYDMSFVDPSYKESKPTKVDSKRSISTNYHTQQPTMHHKRPQPEEGNFNRSHYSNKHEHSNQYYNSGSSYKNDDFLNRSYRSINYSNPRQEQQYSYRPKMAPLSPEDQYRKTIADENRKIVLRHPEMIDWNGTRTIGIDHHFIIPRDIKRKGSIKVFDCSTIKAAIECHSSHSESKICLLNFANSIKPGGGYLNGRNAQEECLCRQTLLYPTIQKSYMYSENKRKGSRPEASDIMIYSSNVMVIRDDNYKMIRPFPVDIISSAAVDNRSGNIYNIEEIMTNRIRKIILAAAEENAEILVLGAFGCGVFKNDPTSTARIFYKILVEENYQRYFHFIIFPIYNNPKLYHIFCSILKNK